MPDATVLGRGMWNLSVTQADIKKVHICSKRLISLMPRHGKYFEDIMPKGPYPPCVNMAGRALLAGYHRFVCLKQIKHYSTYSELYTVGVLFNTFRKYKHMAKQNVWQCVLGRWLKGWCCSDYQYKTKRVNNWLVQKRDAALKNKSKFRLVLLMGTR